MIAALVGGDAEAAFDQGEVLAILAEQCRREAVVVERQYDLRCRRVGGLKRDAVV